MKYKGPVNQAPQEIRTAVEAAWGGPLPEDAWIDVDLENRPEWANISCKISREAGRIDAPFPSGATV